MEGNMGPRGKEVRRENVRQVGGEEGGREEEGIPQHKNGRVEMKERGGEQK